MSTAVWCVHLFPVCSWWNVYVNIVVACHISEVGGCVHNKCSEVLTVCVEEREGSSEHVLFRALRGKTSTQQSDDAMLGEIICFWVLQPLLSSFQE